MISRGRSPLTYPQEVPFERRSWHRRRRTSRGRGVGFQSKSPLRRRGWKTQRQSRDGGQRSANALWGQRSEVRTDQCSCCCFTIKVKWYVRGASKTGGVAKKQQTDRQTDREETQAWFSWKRGPPEEQDGITGSQSQWLIAVVVGMFSVWCITIPRPQITSFPHPTPTYKLWTTAVRRRKRWRRSQREFQEFCSTAVRVMSSCDITRVRHRRPRSYFRSVS